MYRKNRIYKAQYNPWFEAATGDLEIYYPWIRKDNCMCMNIFITALLMVVENWKQSLCPILGDA